MTLTRSLLSLQTWFKQLDIAQKGILIVGTLLFAFFFYAIVHALSAPAQVSSKAPITAQADFLLDNTVYHMLTNDEIIADTDKCLRAGLDAEALIDTKQYGARIIYIQCKPKN